MLNELARVGNAPDGRAERSIAQLARDLGRSEHAIHNVRTRARKKLTRVVQRTCRL